MLIALFPPSLIPLLSHTRPPDDGELYGGPVFEQLSEGLQDSIYAHLEDHGVDEDLCFYILAVSRSKEQSEYVHWLQGMLELAGGEGGKKLGKGRG